MASEIFAELLMRGFSRRVGDPAVVVVVVVVPFYKRNVRRRFGRDRKGCFET